MKLNVSYQNKRSFAGVLMVLPSFMVLFVFFLLPVLLSINYSFTDWNGISNSFKYIGFKNFIDVISESSFIQIILNTLYLTLLYVPILNIFALVLATLVYGVGTRMGNFYKSMLFFPNLLSMVVVGFIWKLMYMYDGGLINQIFNLLGLSILAHDWLGSPSLVIASISLSIIWFATGYYLVIYLAGLNAIPIELYESCDVEGANGMQKFLKITIPMLAPSITINVILSTIDIIASFDLPFVLTNGGPGYMSETIALRVYHYAFTNLQQGRSLALSMMLTLFAVTIAFVELKIFRKREDIY